MIRTMVRRMGATVLLATLVACGGGGGDSGDGNTLSAAPSGPPAAAATMGSSSTDASDSAKAAVGAADGMMARQGSLSGLTVLGAPLAGSAPGVAFSALVGSAGLKQAQAASTAPCTQVLGTPCSGSVTVSTNVADNATSVARGQYIEGTFNALSGSLNGVAVSLSGKLRIEFLTAFNLNTSSVAGIGLRLVFTSFAGSVGGVAVGPVTETLDISFDAQGLPTLVINGASYSPRTTAITSGGYTITSGDARVGYGAAASGHVNVRLVGWTSNASRPGVGSFATVSANGWAANVSVLSSSSSTVVYEVFIAGPTPGSSARFTVTATYPVGGGAPSYVAVPAA